MSATDDAAENLRKEIRKAQRKLRGLKVSVEKSTQTEIAAVTHGVAQTDSVTVPYGYFPNGYRRFVFSSAMMFRKEERELTRLREDRAAKCKAQFAAEDSMAAGVDSVAPSARKEIEQHKKHSKL